MDAAGSTSNEVTVRLSGAEALVLADALSRWQGAGEIARMGGSDEALIRVLDDLTAAFEPLVDVAFAPDYAQHVERARIAVLAV